jgi:MFS family permease
MLQNRDFMLFWTGLVFSQVGVRATLAANLYHVYVITGSTLQTGLVGLAQGVALIVVSPLGGAVADRIDRRRLLQVSQGSSMLFSLGLGLVTVLGVVETWHIFLAVILNTTAQTFDGPARQALIPALVDRKRLIEAFAMIQSSNKVAMLVGPALAGLVIAVSGPGLVYLLDALTYVGLIVSLAFLNVPPKEVRLKIGILKDIVEGARFVKERPLLYQLMSLDYAATLFGAYRVLLPAFALDILDVGPEGYGLLSAAPAVGALLGSLVMLRIVRNVRAGRFALASTIAFGVTVVAFAQSRWFLWALLAAGLIGMFDAFAVTVRHSAVQLETPDELRGRVSSIYQMSSRSGPALGDLNIGWFAGIVGPSLALTLGGTIPIFVATAYWVFGTRIAEYRVTTTGSKSVGPT